MANFTCNPFAFLPSGFTIKQVPFDRKVRVDMALSATPPLCNDDFAIAESKKLIPIHLRHVAMQEVARLLNHDRDDVVGETYLLGEDNEITFLRMMKTEEDSDLSIPLPRARKVARKLWFEDTPSSSNIQFSSHIAEAFEHATSLVVITEVSDDDSETQATDNLKGYDLTPSALLDDLHASPSRKRCQRSKPITPLCTTEVHRSPRSNKYMDLKVHLPSDCRGHKSMIKPRVSIEITDPAPNIISEAASSNSVPPPPTTIKCI
ncbi:hypothetical protein D1007_51431 [Hordeum vulgare]|nr:hypothetical protein D1007_51431 [Hordeum vulgare]